jgi:hypothetical protein
MNELENQILAEISNGCVTLKRYIDDYFAFLLSKEFTGDIIGLNNAIKFTIILPTNNQLPFLDTLVTLNPHNKIFSKTLHVKPIHSRCITPSDSHGSISSKRAIVIGEVMRAIKCSTDFNFLSQKQSLNLITEL